MREKNEREIRISVRALVEFILREGDIEGSAGGFRDKEAMQAGSRMHRKLQGRMGLEYQAEYALKEQFDCGDFVIVLEGRADGIWTKADGVTVDEIKGIYRDLTHMEEPYGVHLAQAKVYAYLYAYQHGLDRMQVRMTYVNLDTEEVKYFYSEYTMQELTDWFLPVLAEYEKWARFQYEWRQKRQASIHETVFPYPYREGQKELAEAVYRTIYHGRRLFIQAPTGVGKTLSTVFPAVKAIGENLADKLFYLTAKTVTRTVAEEAFAALEAKGLAMKRITLTAKEKLCVCEEMICDPQHCPRAKGHYDRVNDALYEMVTAERELSRGCIEKYAEAHQVCPFEFSLDASLWCDAIICDYNYVFDPRVRLKRFFGEGISGNYLFLVDEAHNLVDRARTMFSAQLCKEDFLEMKRTVRAYRPKLERALQAANHQLLLLKRECESCTVVNGIDGFVLMLMNVASELENFMEDLQREHTKQVEFREQLLEFYFEVRNFLNMYDRVDDHYLIYTYLAEDGRFFVKLFCVNPAVNLSEVFEKGVSSILFSATLLPIVYYRRLLSGREDDYAVYAPSPFPRAHKCVLVAQDVSSKYTRRNPAEYEKIAAYIRKVCGCRRGNYMVFFPSYKFLESVYACMEIHDSALQPLFHETADGMWIGRQRSNMREEEREAFLGAFETETDRTLIGFCVTGGIFGEGIDLKGERLIGALVVGTGLPQIDQEGELLREYYDEHLHDGFSYAYRYPGMNKVLQAAGRVIRTMDDRGVIVLLDERFLQRDYRGLFPREWEGYETCRLLNVQEKVKKFWECKT